MTLTINAALEETATVITFLDHQGTITIIENNQTNIEKNLAFQGIYLAISNYRIQSLGIIGKDLKKQTDWDKLVFYQTEWDTEDDYLIAYLTTLLSEKKYLTGEKQEVVKIPKNHYTIVEKKGNDLLLILERFGYLGNETETTVTKKKPAKAQHRWNKEVSTVPFYLDSRGSKATVYWQKRNEMLIKAGATMNPETPLNKDGSLGFAAKMGQKIRDDNQNKYENFVTTEDLVLKSVNEVGLFLYFGGTNGWLELKDDQGRTIDDWTVVK